jgi:hypothetical protein
VFREHSILVIDCLTNIILWTLFCFEGLEFSVGDLCVAL